MSGLQVKETSVLNAVKIGLGTTMNNYSTSNGCFYIPEELWTNPNFYLDPSDKATVLFRTSLLISSIRDSLKRGSLDWNDERAWSDLEMGYSEIKGGK